MSRVITRERYSKIGWAGIKEFLSSISGFGEKVVSDRLIEREADSVADESNLKLIINREKEVQKPREISLEDEPVVEKVKVNEIDAQKVDTKKIGKQRKMQKEER